MEAATLFNDFFLIERRGVMKRSIVVFIILFISFITFPTVSHAASDTSDLPWKKGYLNLGYFIAVLDSSFRLGESNLGIGLEIDVEDFLGLDSTDRAFRIDAGYRFGKTQKRKVEFSWFNFDRESTGFLDKQITIPPESGGGTIGPGAVKSVFNFDIIKLKYEYSLILDERVDLNVGGGLFIMPFEISVEVGAGGVGTGILEEDITAPLPVFSLGFDYAFTPKWILRQQLDLFYLEIDQYRGSIVAGAIALEYLPWKNVGIGLGYDSLNVKVESEDDTSVPGVDFNGEIGFYYRGLQFYVKLFF
jgi:hypothetical protein